ncbi:DUF2474 family protein [Frateuria aurantia]
MKNSTSQTSESSTAKRLGWMVVLWLVGVLGAVVIASIFKVLMLGAVKVS